MEYLHDKLHGMSTIKRLSSGPHHYFFGYYGINPWSSNGQTHLALSVKVDNKTPAYQETAQLGLIHAADGSFTKITETSGWNLQQGCMAHWARVDEQDCIAYNDVINDMCVSNIMNLDGKLLKQHQSGLCALAADGHSAYGLDFSRMYHCRSVVGYTNPNTQIQLCPDNNGIWSFDLSGDRHELIKSIAEVCRASSVPVPKDAACWLNHVLPNPQNTSVMFVARYRDGEHFRTSLWSMNNDGTDLHEEIPFGGHISHFCWRDDETLIVSTTDGGKSPMRFMSVKRGSNQCNFYGGETLSGDSHLCFAPNGEFAVGDRYPDAQGNAHLFLFNPSDETAIPLGTFPHPAQYRGDIRCDLHPRWSNDSKTISFDSIHEGKRAIYLLEL